jgi:hypothetical protein
MDSGGVMFRRWAEARIYRKTVQLAVGELRRAARTGNALEKLDALEVAEQKLEDALWLCPSGGQADKSRERFEGGLAEVRQSRERALRELALPMVARLLERAEKEAAEREGALEAAGELLSFLNHYLPDDTETEILSARFRELGGTPRPYRPMKPLSEVYHRPEPGLGCVIALMVLVLALVVVCSTIW